MNYAPQKHPLPAWQIERQNILHRACLAIQRGIAAGQPVSRSIRLVAKRNDGRFYKSAPRKVLKVPYSSMRRWWDTASGVSFQHYGRAVRVKAGGLEKHIGRELWALVDRADASLVTFMNLDFTDPFTVEACNKPLPNETTAAPGSGVLAAERAKVREHERAISEEYRQMMNDHGNPRRELLSQIRKQPAPAAAAPVRHVVIDPRMQRSGEQMEQQRAAIKTGQEEKAVRVRRASRKASALAVPQVMVSDDEETRRGLELFEEARRMGAEETQKENEL